MGRTENGQNLTFCFSKYSSLLHILKNKIYSYETRKPCIKTVNFMTPRVWILTIGWGQNGHSLTYIMLKNPILYFCRCCKKTGFKLRQTMKPSSKTVNSLSLGIGFLTLRRSRVGKIMLNVYRVLKASSVQCNSADIE